MREIEERYAKMVEESTQGVWFVDTSLVIRYVNRSMADMLGYAREEMLGRPALRLRRREPPRESSVRPGAAQAWDSRTGRDLLPPER